MNERLKALLEERASIWTQMQEVGSGGFEDAQQREQYENLETKLGEIQAEVEVIERHLERVQTFTSPENAPVETPEQPAGDAETDAERYARVYDQYLRTGITEDWEAEDYDLMKRNFNGNADTRALGTVAGSAGGYTVPEGFWQQIVDARSAFGGLRNAPVFQLTTGDGADIPIPTGDDDSGNAGAYVGENQTIGTQDVSFDQKVLKAFTITSKIVKVPVQLVQDSAFDLQAYLAGKLGERIGRGEAAAFATGNGLQQPEGLTAAAPTGRTCTGSTTFVYQDWVNFIHSVDPAYRDDPSSGFVMHDSALKAARLITVSSTDSRPLWQPGMAVGEPSTILGYRYWIDNSFPTVATTSKSVAFGALANYWIRDVAGMTLVRFGERFMDALQVGFLVWARNDGRLVDAGTNPIKVMKMG